jgi:hypothetical protein
MRALFVDAIVGGTRLTGELFGRLQGAQIEALAIGQLQFEKTQWARQLRGLLFRFSGERKQGE